MIAIDKEIAGRILDLLVGMEGSSFRHPHFFDLRTVQDGIVALKDALAKEEAK